MANFNFQGKIIRQFWSKLIRQFSKFSKTLGLQFVTWGGGLYSLLNSYLSNKITFFHHGIRAG